MTFETDEPGFSLEKDLAELARTNPEVARAEANLERVKAEILRDPHFVRNRADGRVHISDLKHMAISPKAYEYACRHPKPRTRPMTVGAVADRLVFGFGRAVCYDGVRTGAKWEAFRSANADAEICIASEWEDANRAAEAVLRDPVACELLKAPKAEYQRVMHWTAYGLPFAAGVPGIRGGVDLIAGGVLADLKVTTDVEPLALCKHVTNMLWPQQLAAYVDGARSLGLEIETAALICVEATPPNDVVVLTFNEGDFEDARKSLVLWTEKLKACERIGAWPGHVQSAIPYERPAWMDEG